MPTKPKVQPAKASTKPKVARTHDHSDDSKFRRLLEEIQLSFKAVANVVPLFRTDAQDLFGVYLNAFPRALRQHYNCNTCKSFLRKFGGLVTIDPDTGITTSALWGRVDRLNLAPEFHKVVTALNAAVASARVTGVFLPSTSTLGTPEAGGWEHLHVTGLVPFHHATLRAGQAMAKQQENVKNVKRALGEFSEATLSEVVSLLHSGLGSRPEKFLGPAEWLLDLKRRSHLGPHNHSTHNIIVRAVAEAPDGYCHPRSSVLGTLYTDLAEGVPVKAAFEKFKAKLDPRVYQRPQAAPTAGNIEVAEKLVAKLGLADSLRRREATLSDLLAFWTSPGADGSHGSPTGGVFAHLRQPAGSRTPSVAPTSTFAKFRRDLLPHCVRLEAKVPTSGAFTGFLTEAVPGSAPILKWDKADARNPVSTYQYVNGSFAGQWGLSPGAFVEVLALVGNPAHWRGPFPGEADLVLGILKGARDVNSSNLCLFPEILRPELREVRATLEAHSRAGSRERVPTPANGIIMAGITLRAHLSGGSVVDLLIDRLE